MSYHDEIAVARPFGWVVSSWVDKRSRSAGLLALTLLLAQTPDLLSSCSLFLFPASHRNALPYRPMSAAIIPSNGLPLSSTRYPQSRSSTRGGAFPASAGLFAPTDARLAAVGVSTAASPASSTKQGPMSGPTVTRNRAAAAASPPARASRLPARAAARLPSTRPLACSALAAPVRHPPPRPAPPAPAARAFGRRQLGEIPASRSARRPGAQASEGAFRRRRRTIRPHRRRARGGRRLHRSTPRLTNRVQQQISHPPHPGPSVTTRVLYSEPTSSALLSFATVPTLASSSTSLCSPPPACPYNLRYKRAKTTAKPVRETREKQVQLWKDLILDYCRSQKIHTISLEEDFPLFSNPKIERSLSHEAKEVFLAALVSEGRAEWMDKGHKKCLILWLRIQDWANFLINFVKDNGLEVMTIEEIRSGTDTRGTGET
uniref:Vacuolar protein sorting-associated protein 25 n=1 Tax=Setaria italica TaxID=4555 RepID=K3ZTH5_SETIT